MRGSSVFRRRRMSAKGHLLNFSKLRFLCRKRIHNRRPSRINPFENEGSIFDGAVHEKPLRHIRFVRVQVDEFPRSQDCCGKQDGELPLLHFTGLIEYPFTCENALFTRRATAAGVRFWFLWRSDCEVLQRQRPITGNGNLLSSFGEGTLRVGLELHSAAGTWADTSQPPRVEV